MPSDKKYINYGCGFCAPQGWLNFDASPTILLERVPLLGRLMSKNPHRFPTNVRYGNIVKGLPLESESCDAIFCSHVLEHLAFNDVQTALRNTFSYLKPGGIFRLVVPDLEQLARAYLEAQDPDAASRFLHQANLGKVERRSGIVKFGIEWMGNSYHLWMWDFKSMCQQLRQAGFQQMRRATFGDSQIPAFEAVEEEGRFRDCLAIHAIK
jgi:ubiquinone/menaquinone biosynthesis C-methylase UbiE